MENKILNLINSVEFQELNSYYNEKTIFGALNVERNENRHSAFVAWWLNPKSEHGLGDAPLKLFLRLVATKEWGKWIFKKDFYSRVLAGDYNITIREDFELEKSVGKFDICSALELTAEDEDGKDSSLVIGMVIENKIYSDEGKNQTLRYFDAVNSYMKELPSEMEYSGMGVLLTAAKQKPSCDQFINITYQELLTYVIEPLMSSVDTKLDKLFKSSNRDNSKYVVSYNGTEIFPGKRLSKAMAACAIFKAYLMEYPATTLAELRNAFPCEKLNAYYYDRYYNDMFYESNPDNVNETGYEILTYTAGKHKGKEAKAKWDFYLDEEKLLPIENGQKNAMCVKMWRKGDFDKLVEFVEENYKFIGIEEC